jgi:hypothetical protein
MEKLDATALARKVGMAGDEFAQAAAVDESYSGEVQQDLTLALRRKFLDGLSQKNGVLTKRDLPTQIDDRDIAVAPRVGFQFRHTKLSDYRESIT